MSVIGTAAMVSSLHAQPSPAAKNTDSFVDEQGDKRFASHPIYSSCKPPADFAKRFPKYNLKKVMKRSSKGSMTEGSMIDALRAKSMLIGAHVDTNDVYRQKAFGMPITRGNMAYAGIRQKFGEQKKHYIGLTLSKNDVYYPPYVSSPSDEIFVPVGPDLRHFKKTGNWRSRGCASANPPAPKQCFATAYVEFEIDPETFNHIAKSDPSQPFLIIGKKYGGKLPQCPYYLSPLSFKATSLLIDEQYKKTLKKRDKRLAKNDKE